MPCLRALGYQLFLSRPSVDPEVQAGIFVSTCLLCLDLCVSSSRLLRPLVVAEKRCIYTKMLPWWREALFRSHCNRHRLCCSETLSCHRVFGRGRLLVGQRRCSCLLEAARCSCRLPEATPSTKSTFLLFNYFRKLPLFILLFIILLCHKREKYLTRSNLLRPKPKWVLLEVVSFY